ncbi:MFS transporter [Nonomuraea sp. NPDC048826]|uniref:MFS transporter n=1 Tax=Nonomuraea sp. NPDC048826 TaxID=3364347 RepID=UPI00371C0D47
MSPPAKRLVRTLYVYTFLDEFVLLYPVYALLFTDTGLSVAETSSLFVIWSLTGLVLEVPSGAWADAVSRRLLLLVGPVLAATGFALWVIFPSYWVFALGFVLWGTRDALTSGAMEALVYEELDRTGETSRYAHVMGRATSVGVAADAAAIAVAIPVFAVGGYPAVGAASVLACLLTAATALAFREHRSPSPAAEAGDEADERSYGQVLKAGLAEARGNPQVLRGLVLVAVLTAVWGALEEYVPFLGTETGVAEKAIPLVVLLVWVGATAGGLLAGRARRLRARGFGAVLAVAAAALAGGALSGHPAGFVLIAAAFGMFQMADVVADARLQDSITGPSRATVTSVAGLGTSLITLAVYVFYGAAAGHLSHGVVFALLSVPYLLVAVWVATGRRTDGTRSSQLDNRAVR